MKYYTSTTEFNCGIDLHARQMYVCVMDRQGRKLVHTNVSGGGEAGSRKHPGAEKRVICGFERSGVHQ
jgi:hypothetical protein